MPISHSKFEFPPMRLDDVPHLTGGQRLHLAFLLSELQHEIIRQRIRDAHPEWTEMRVRIEFIRIIFLPQRLPKWSEQRFMAECDQFRPEDPVQ